MGRLCDVRHLRCHRVRPRHAQKYRNSAQTLWRVDARGWLTTPQTVDGRERFQTLANAGSDAPKTSSGDVERAIQFNCVSEVMIMKREILKFLKEEEGLTIVEYAIAGSLVAGGAVAAFTLLGGNIATFINWLGTQIVTP